MNDEYEDLRRRYAERNAAHQEKLAQLLSEREKIQGQFVLYQAALTVTWVALLGLELWRLGAF